MTSRRALCPSLPLFLGIALSAATASAQCSTGWVPGGAAGVNGPVYALATLANGEMVASAVLFPQVGTSQVIRFDGTSWLPLGPTMDRGVGSLIELPNGDIVAGGDFTRVGTTTAFGLARWDGSAWTGMGGTNGPVLALALLPNGNLVVGGNFTSIGGVAANRIAIHDGTGFTPLGSGIGFAGVRSLAVLQNGDIVAGGNFATAGGAPAASIARWDGTNWHSMASPFGFAESVLALRVLSNGDIVAGGDFDPGVLRWNGTTWTDFGGASFGTAILNGYVYSLAILPNGDIVAGGLFASISTIGPVDNLARWNGSSWSAISNGPDTFITVLEMRPEGQLIAGGFTSAFGAPTHPHMAFLESSCPATTSPAGVGCAGSAGLNALTATSLPWTGSTFRARASGMTNNALAISLFGLTMSSTPLPTLLPQGVAGCSLHVSTESIQLLLPSAGMVETRLAIPNTMVFTGLALHHQVLPMELNAQNNITAVTSTNALTLTIGTF